MEKVIRPQLASLAVDVIAAMGEQVPGLGELLGRQAGQGARQNFVDVFEECVEGAISGGPDAQGQARRIHRAFVTQVFLAGHTLGTLLAACQVAARVVWNRLSVAGQETGAAPTDMYLLARVMFDRLEHLSAVSTEIFERLGEDPLNVMKERRLALIKALVGEGVSDGRPVPDLAREAAWRLPETLACVALGPRPGDARTLFGLTPDVLLDVERPDPYLLVPAPDLPGRKAMFEQCLGGITHALGPSVPYTDGAVSLRLARRALVLADEGMIQPDGDCIRCDDHLATLHLLADDDCARLLVDRTLNAFADVSDKRLTPLLETLLALLTRGSSAPEIAEHLNVHPQTVRYRIRQIENYCGISLNDPQWRIETQLALRIWRLHRTREQRRTTTPTNPNRT
ncbi:helix-turn-helix domain-containing protein [Actinocorallia herbida]|uniref:PucR family transcriptional regulator n=1 Tax=Actinocorallia herbida TaxID=58109 RepID=UPI0014776CE5|nr:helix-turn-helix domain-containing protein [Actinocorallia herbida]